MKKALGRAASSGEQARALDRWLPEIKNDLWNDEGGSHELLESDDLILLTEGTHRYNLPSDFESEKSFSILDGDVRETAQAGTSTSITLVLTDSSEASGRIGKEIVLIGGTGSGQKRQITGFNITTKVAEVDSAWSIIPESDTDYLLVSDYVSLFIIDPTTFAKITDRTTLDRPSSAMIWNDQLYIQKVPDKTYVLWVQYWANILKIDVADTNVTHQKMLMDWQSLFVEGVYFKTLQNEDDTRADLEFVVYRDMISRVTTQSQRSGRVEPHSF